MRFVSDSAHAIVRTLADGSFHSGEQLAQQLGITRSAVWKHVRRLESLGLKVFSVPGRGYRLQEPVDLLDKARVQGLLTDRCRGQLRSLEVLDKVESTNAWLMAEAGDFPAVCLAEWQTHGRGRRGRPWVSPYASNLYLSFGWQFDEMPSGFTALGMVAAIAAVHSLRALQISKVAIKWPNDLMVSGRKLGGVLVEMQGEPPGRVRTVIGIGINVRMPGEAARQIDQPWTDLATLGLDQLPDRNHLAAAIVEQLMSAVRRFAQQGFQAFGRDWRELDLTAGRLVQLQHQNQIVTGTALGVDPDGALLLSTATGTQRFVSGDLSLRIQT